MTTDFIRFGPTDAQVEAIYRAHDLPDTGSSRYAIRCALVEVRKNPEAYGLAAARQPGVTLSREDADTILDCCEYTRVHVSWAWHKWNHGPAVERLKQALAALEAEGLVVVRRDDVDLVLDAAWQYKHQSEYLWQKHGYQEAYNRLRAALSPDG